MKAFLPLRVLLCFRRITSPGPPAVNKDNQSVFAVLKSLTAGGSGEVILRKQNNTRNGRNAFLEMNSQKVSLSTVII
jgi:hypothetical protein